MSRIRTIAVVCAATALSATACSSSTSTSSKSGAPGSPDAVKKYSMALIVGNSTDPFYVTMGCGATQAAKKLGISLDVQGATTWGPDRQTPIVNAEAGKNLSALIAVPTDSKAMYAPLKTISANGTKIVLADTTLDDTGFVTSAVATDNTAAGALAADTMAKLIGGNGHVLLVGDLPGVSTVNQRRAGFEQQMKKYPGITVSQNIFDPVGTAPKVAALVGAALNTDKDVVGVYTLYTAAGEGAATAIKDNGKTGQVKLISFDASPTEVDAVRSGQIDALIAQEPAQIGAKAVESAYNSLTGKPVEKAVGTTAFAITKDNVDDPATAQYFYKPSC